MKEYFIVMSKNKSTGKTWVEQVFENRQQAERIAEIMNQEYICSEHYVVTPVRQWQTTGS